jgi:type I restriction enzyme S subunit
VRATRTAVAQSAPETGEELLARILTERRKAWQGRGDYKEPAPPKTADLPSLPDGWRWTRLEQLGFIFGGLTKNPKRARLPKQLPYLRVANVYANELRLQEIEHIGVQDSELAKLLVRAGDLLIVEGNGSKDHIGRLAIWDGSIALCVHQNHLIKVRPVETGMPKWMLHWLQSPGGRHFVELVASSTSGLYTLSVNKVGDLPIPLASLPEQRRIVAEIEKQLTRLEAGVAALRRVQANLKRYRAAVLKAACEGRLVPTEAKLAKTGKHKSTFETGEALLARILTERRKNWQDRVRYTEPPPPEVGDLDSLPDGWSWSSLAQLSAHITDGTHKTPNYLQSGVPFLSAKDIAGFKLSFDECRYISESEHAELSGRCAAHRGNVLITKSGTIGRVAVVETDREFSLFESVANVPVTPPLNAKFVAFAAYFSIGGVFGAANQKGVAVRHLHLEDLRRVPIPLPPVPEQTRIVAEVERRLSVVEELEAVVAANLQRATRLRQSILQKAFTGELV